MTPSEFAALKLPSASEVALSPTAQVKAAIAAAGERKTTTRGNRFLFDGVSKREAVVAPLLGIYLGFSVARIHERFPALEVPYLLWGMMAVMLLTLVAAVPGEGWLKAWKNSPQLRLVAVLTVLAIVTVPLGIWAAGSLAYLMNKFTVALGVYIACLFLLRDRKILRRVVMLYVTITTVVATVNLVEYFNKDLVASNMTAEEQLAYEATGVISAAHVRQSFGSLDPNDIAAVMATTVPLALWLAVGSFGRRVLWSGAALVLVVAVIPTASRGGLVGLAVAAIVLVLVGAKGGKRVFLVGTLAVGAVAFMALAGSQMDRMDDFGGTDYNYTASEGRIAIWKRGIVWMIRRPWGHGIDNFPTYFAWMNGPDRAAHNSLIQYGVELGVLGLAAYLLICWTLVKSLLRIRRQALLSSDSTSRDIAVLCGHVLAMLGACWTTGFFLSNAYYPITYMAIGIGSAVVLSSVDRLKAPLPAPPGPQTLSSVRGGRRRFRAFEPA